MSEERRSGGEGGADQGPEKRKEPVVIDLERLEKHAEQIYLHRFVAYIRKLRDEHGRYLTLRAGDETAILAADDGSAESLKEVLADPDETDT